MVGIKMTTTTMAQKKSTLNGIEAMKIRTKIAELSRAEPMLMGNEFNLVARMKRFLSQKNRHQVTTTMKA